MAAELFRARYGDEPFVSLFVTGRDLHVFSNCETVRLERGDVPAVDLQEAPHNIVKLEGAFTGVRAEGVRNGATVRKELRPWGEAAAVMISIDETEVESGRTVAVDLTICDDAGTPVRDWNGQVRAEAEGDGQLFPYTDASEVEISRGEGRTYLQLGRSGKEVVIRSRTDGLADGSLSIRIEN